MKNSSPQMEFRRKTISSWLAGAMELVIQSGAAAGKTTSKQFYGIIDAFRDYARLPTPYFRMQPLIKKKITNLGSSEDAGLDGSEKTLANLAYSCLDKMDVSYEDLEVILDAVPAVSYRRQVLDELTNTWRSTLAKQ